MRYLRGIASKIIVAGVVLATIAVLAACGPVELTVQPRESPAASTADTATPPATSTALASPLATGTDLPTEQAEEMNVSPIPTAPTPDSSGLQDLVAQAKQDLADRLSMDVDQIDLIEVESVVWPDASLGCPQPGMQYKQVPQDGALILLAVEEKFYEYHSGGGRDPFLCEPQPLVPKTTIPQIDIVPTPGSEDD